MRGMLSFKCHKTCKIEKIAACGQLQTTQSLAIALLLMLITLMKMVYRNQRSISAELQKLPSIKMVSSRYFKVIGWLTKE